jgi:hypothetical protein
MLGTMRPNQTFGSMGNDRFIDRTRPRTAFSASLATVTITTPLARHQVFQVAFGRDGSIYFTFPYFEGPADGLVSNLTFPERAAGTVGLDLRPGGKVTAHRVKASHHQNGRAHFSLTPHVKPLVGRQSLRLEDQSGLLFQLQCYWLSSCRLLPPGSEKAGRLYLHFAAPDEVPAGLTVTGEWRRMAELPPNVVIDGQAEPFVRLHPAGVNGPSTALVLAAPPGSALDQHCLILQAAPLSPIPGLPDTAMIFLGGFDYAAVPVGAPAGPGSGCTTFLYPIPDREALGAVIGSTDA